MRLGSNKVILKDDCRTAGFYGATTIHERHRHRYEVNPEYIDKIDQAGLRFVGKSEDGVRMEVAELDDHPFFIACQFHPEFLSRPNRPSILHREFIKAAMEFKKSL